MVHRVALQDCVLQIILPIRGVCVCVCRGGGIHTHVCVCVCVSMCVFSVRNAVPKPAQKDQARWIHNSHISLHVCVGGGGGGGVNVTMDVAVAVAVHYVHARGSRIGCSCG